VNADADSNQTQEATSSTAQADTAEVPEVKALKAELAAEKDQILRLAADFDNFRKRVAQESERRAEAQKKAFILELLPIIDNLERALGSGQSASREQLLQGVEMTLQQLYRLLRAHGVEPEESVGQPFDPRYHEAVASRHDPTQPDHVILETFQRGYRYRGESFRPAKVVVNDLSKAEPAKAKSSEDGPSQDTPSDDAE
jgi:molecular chaperone GrpE